MITPLTTLLLLALLGQDPAPPETPAETPAETPIPQDIDDEEARALEEGEGTGLDPDAPLHGEKSDQETGLEKVDPDELDTPDIGELARGPQAEQEAAEELLALFNEVDTKLQLIDTMLFDIGAGERPLEAPQDSGLGELLGLTRQASDDVVDGIDRILKLADEMGQDSQSQQSGQSQQSQQQQGQQQSQDQSQQPEGQEGNKPEPGSEEPHDQGGDEPEDGEGQKPEDAPGQDEAEGQNQPQGAGQDHQVGPGSEANETERWGELPERVRETFRNQGGEQAPLFYREWIESYYRRLNEADGR